MPIEQNAPELERIVSSGASIEKLGDGYGGDQGPAEGPLWWKEGGYLLFSDIHNNKRMKWAQGEGVTLFQEPTNRANGLTRDLQGRLLAAEHDSRRVTRQEPDGSITVVANNFQGQRLNRPNDVVVKSDGAIYFTDPWTSPLPREQWDLTFSGVYRVTPDLGTLTLLVGDFIVPNGLAFSPDESVLYVNDTRRGHIRAFDMQPNGTMAIQSDRVFADLTVAENLNVGGMIGSRPLVERKDEIFEWFPVLADLSQQLAGTLSGGESRMLACARALMQEPKLLLLDEPTTGLSPLYVDMFFEKIMEIRKSRGVSIILAEQNATKALEVADRVMVLSLGEVFLTGDAKELTTDLLKEGYRI